MVPEKKGNQPLENPLLQIKPKDDSIKKPELIEIRKLWKEFQQQKDSQGATSEANVLNKEPDLDEEGNIRIRLLKGLEEEIFRKIKVDLLHYLRHQSACFELDIRIEIIEEQKKKMLYTAQEKFEFLADKNPQLRELKKRLGLDLHF